ncbi:MAG: SoxR reducing system RseC family protein [Oscillospiraceae bacterium]|nr:SoxR reducing system RseC family protein [Oscillospiraceae bacterium]
MTQKVMVKACYPDGTALVLHLRQSACSGDCHQCSGCGAAQESLLLTAQNPIGARPGDLVVIQSETGPVLMGAAVLYMLPLVLFFLGYALGAALWQMGALVGCLAFAASIAVCVLYDRKIARKKKTIYTITEFARKEQGGF